MAFQFGVEAALLGLVAFLDVQAGEQLEHFAGAVRAIWFAENNVAECNDRVGAEHDVVGVPRTHPMRLLDGEMDGRMRWEHAAGNDFFVDVRRLDDEVIAGVAQERLAPRAGASEDEAGRGHGW